MFDQLHIVHVTCQVANMERACKMDDQSLLGKHKHQTPPHIMNALSCLPFLNITYPRYNVFCIIDSRLEVPHCV